MSRSRLRVEANGPLLEITFDHPPAHAFDERASRDLDAALTRLNETPELRCAIVTATGNRIFSAGWDLKAVAAGETGEDFGPNGFMGLRRFDLLKPVNVAVNRSMPESTSDGGTPKGSRMPGATPGDSM